MIWSFFFFFASALVGFVEEDIFRGSFLCSSGNLPLLVLFYIMVDLNIFQTVCDVKRCFIQQGLYSQNIWGNIICKQIEKKKKSVFFSLFHLWFQHILGTQFRAWGPTFSPYSSALCFSSVVWPHGLPYAAPGPLSCVKVSRRVRGLVLRASTLSNRGSEVVVKCWLPEFRWKTLRAFPTIPCREPSGDQPPGNRSGNHFHNVTFITFASIRILLFCPPRFPWSPF